MAEIGYGARFFIDNDEIENVTNITPPAPEVSDVESTHLQSTDRWKTYVAGLKDGGEVTVDCHYTETLFATLYAELGESGTYTIEFNDSDDVIQFDGYCKKVEPTIGGPEDLKMLKSVFKVSGSVDIQAPSSTYP